MPNNATGRIAAISTIDAIHCVLHCKKLLMTGNLLNIAIIKNEITHQRQKACMVKHRSTYTILLGNMSVGGASVTYFFLPIDVIFAPLNEIVCSGAASTINHLVRIHSHNKLGIFEKMRDIIRSHIANVLQYALFHINTRLLAFYYNNRNAIYHQHDVGTCILTIGAFYAEFLGHLPNIVCGMLKVDIGEVKGLTNGNILIENNVFLKADAKR